jgi:hypothetical protein
MGLDYSYNIICRRDQMWDVLDAAGKRAWGDFREYSAKFELDDRDIERPLRDVWERELILEETPIRDISTDTSIWFEYDDAIRDWVKKNQYDEGEEDGRYIGSIYVYIYPFLHYEYGDEVTLLDCDDVEISFTAATTCMSRLFENSVSIRNAFIEIAKAHEGAICVLDREGSDIVVWFEGEEVWTEVGDSNTSREILTERVKQNRAAKKLL